VVELVMRASEDGFKARDLERVSIVLKLSSGRKRVVYSEVLMGVRGAA